MSMEAITIASGFGMPLLPPSSSIFKGRGLYQIHLVKADAIRPFIPKHLQLVQTLGYTLGGFYLGNYEDSSFGAFDELVVIAGIVKTGTSSPSAWSAKVLINNDQVRDYAQKELGVVSQVAKFSKKIKAGVHERKGGFLNMNGLGKWPKNYKHIHIHIMEDDSSCNFIIKSTAAAADADSDRFTSPQIKLSFPNLSGLTEHIPHQLLQYTCHMETRVKVVAAAKVSCGKEIVESRMQETDHMCKIVVESKPFVAFEFNPMKMMLDSPTLVKTILQ